MKLRPEVNADVLALDPVDRRHAVRALQALAAGDTSAYTTDVLEATHVLLKLEGLRSMKVGDPVSSPLRIVYAVDEAGDVEVISVGLRQRSQVFQAAHFRLHPPAPPERRLRSHTAADWAPAAGRMLT